MIGTAIEAPFDPFLAPIEDPLTSSPAPAVKGLVTLNEAGKGVVVVVMVVVVFVFVVVVMDVVAGEASAAEEWVELDSKCARIRLGNS